MCCKHTHLLIGCCFCSVNPTESMVRPCLWSFFAWYYYGYIEYYYYYYYYHTVPLILIISNKDCSIFPNLQCAFCCFHVCSLLPSHRAVTEAVPSLYMCSHFSAVFDRGSSNCCCAYLGVGAIQIFVTTQHKRRRALSLIGLHRLCHSLVSILLSLG